MVAPQLRGPKPGKDMFYYVYIIKSLKDHNIYTGFTKNLKKRFSEHCLGKVTSTSPHRPLKLIYYEAYLSEKDARSRESYLKKGGNAKVNLKRQISRSLEN